MVATTRSKSRSSCPKQVKDTTPPERLARNPVRFEIPEPLYQAISDAAMVRESLMGTNKNDQRLEGLLHSKERGVNNLAMYYKLINELPSSWEYNHETALSDHVPKPPTPPKKKKKKKIKRKFGTFTTINGIPLKNKEDQKVWMKFKRRDEAIAHQCISFPMENDMIPLEETNPVVDLVAGFAVEAFNDSYHKYVKEHRSKNITQPVPVECKYYKLTSKYYFYVTIDAIEQGKHGVYEAVIECDRANGARTLCKFVLTNRKTKSESSYNQVFTQHEEGERSFHQLSEYEKAWSSDSSDPEDFYKISGMVHRRETSGGGFNYRNPSCGLHRYVLNDVKKK